MSVSEATSRQFSKAEIADQLRALGVNKTAVLLVHTSFRAIQPVEGGPLGLIEAIQDVLGPSGTLVMPSFSGDDDKLFDPATTRRRPISALSRTYSGNCPARSGAIIVMHSRRSDPMRA
jgi:aminoglycoside N3'-acetyltransferase